ncbi:hypothetical protein FZEAL_7400 [Fusarium zealandicum]|uniref:Mid2 domain-containing protein n=1 Tax=Fusarium zealandicum TaxID=1053134 RepID=A0A8H4UFX9_9HYPO|nr:hypothetical protein FZEAL_7400 [Fusarium zealandicum]
MSLSSWRIFYVILVVYTVPTLAYPKDLTSTPAEVEARQALATATQTGHWAYRRQDEETPTYTVTYAPESTCGYLSGLVEIPITCENQGTCLWEQEYFRYIACEIQGKTTGLARTKCLQRDEALNPDLCDDVCVSNTYNLLCTNETQQYCRTYAYPKGVRDYRCAPEPATRVSSVDFTYEGQKNPNFTISTFLEGDRSIEASAASTTATDSDTATHSDMVTDSDKDMATNTTIETTSATSIDSEGNDSGTSLSTGAIAGIAVGSIIGLALACLLCWFFFPGRWNQPSTTELPANISANSTPIARRTSPSQPITNPFLAP